MVSAALGCSLFWASTSLAAPANDNFATADQLIGLPATSNGSNVEATNEADEPSHDFREAGQSVWYWWEAPSSGVVTIDTCGSDFDTVLAVYTGSELKTLTKVASNNWSRGPACAWARQAEVTFNAISGTIYRIAIDGAIEEEWEEEEFEGEGPDPEGEVELAVATTLPPANDDLANADVLSFEPGLGLYFGNDFNWAASTEAGEPDHAADQGGASVWYAWTAPRSGEVIADTCFSDFDTLLAVYTGTSVNALTPVAANDDSANCGPQSRVIFQASAGVTYRIAVDGTFSDGTGVAMGEFWLELWQRPANDGFGEPHELPSSSSLLHSQSTAFATKQVGEPNHAGNFGGSSVWFTWTAPGTGTVSLDTCGSNFDTLLAVYTGQLLSALRSVASNDDSSGLLCPFSDWSALTFAATGGTTYRFAADGAWGEGGNLSLRLSWALTTPSQSSADTTAPDTRIDRARVRGRKGEAIFTFSASEPVEMFGCRLDGGRTFRCSSPRTFKRLKPGRHRLTVTALDLARNEDPTPAERKFRIQKPKHKPKGHRGH